MFAERWDGRPVRLLGIRSSKLVGEDEPEQLSIFDIPVVQARAAEKADIGKEAEETSCAVKAEKQKKLDLALDEIRKKYGEDAVKRGRFL